MKKSLDHVLGEVKRDYGADAVDHVDWDAVDAGLFARIEAERRTEQGRVLRGRRHAWISVAAAGAAAAIVVAVFSGTSRRTGPGAEVSEDANAVTLTGLDGDGQFLVNGSPAAVGAAIRRGDHVEARGVRAGVTRAGKVTALFEPGTLATVTHADSPLVFALEQGAVDAQVTPVPSGEAFAVDVDGSRVAVHGTRLRVARGGGHVVVDLSEGVVSVGEAPRIGSVLGSLVVAPAHMEFASADARGTLAVNHEPSSVRFPVVAIEAAAPPPPDSVFPAKEPVVPPHPQVALRPSPSTSAKGTPVASTGQASAATPAAEPTAPAEATPRPGAPTVVDPVDPQTAIADAVQACMAARPTPDNVTVVVSTELRLSVGDDGSVHSAWFVPPVAPDVNACAAKSIYKAHFPRPGLTVIHVDFKN